MDDDWKGEAIIRRKPENRRKEATRMVNVLYHRQRRAAGIPCAGAVQHHAKIAAALYDMDDQHEWLPARPTPRSED